AQVVTRVRDRLVGPPGASDDRARDGRECGDHPARPVKHARCAGAGLHPDSTRQGAFQPSCPLPARAAKRLRPCVEHHLAPVHRPAQRSTCHRGGLRVARHGPAARVFHHAAGHGDCAGCRVHRGRHGHRRESRDGRSFQTRRPQNPAVMSEVVNPKVPTYPGLARRVLKGARRAGLAGQIGMVLVGLAVLAATVGTFLTPFDPVEVAPRDALMPPFPLEGSDPAHPLGTDNLGRDMFSRLIEGSKISLTVGVLAVALSGTIGLTVGVIAGYAGGWIDSVLMRIVDALISIPSILLIMVVMGVLDPGVTTLIVVLGLTSWVIF